jgi:predicted nuclease with RNAse H fold
MWAGIDVGDRRKGFHAAVVDRDGLAAGPKRLATAADAVDWLTMHRVSVVAVDSPCVTAPEGTLSRPSERRLARAVCGLRYTPDRKRLEDNPYYGWILHGLELYAALARQAWTTIECFPTASVTRWAGPRGSKARTAWSRDYLTSVGFTKLRHGQDGRDAVVAALTARSYAEGATESYGEIVVPSRVAR